MAEMTIEEMEAETARIQKELEARRAKKAKKIAPQRDPAPRRRRDGDRLREIQADTRVKNATLKNAHGGFAGDSIIEKIEKQMDKRRKRLAQMIIDNGSAVRTTPEYILDKGRYEGFAATLALLRYPSTMKEEIARSNERLGIE